MLWGLPEAKLSALVLLTSGLASFPVAGTMVENTALHVTGQHLWTVATREQQGRAPFSLVMTTKNDSWARGECEAPGFYSSI